MRSWSIATKSPPDGLAEDEGGHWIYIGATVTSNGTTKGNAALCTGH